MRSETSLNSDPGQIIADSFSRGIGAWCGLANEDGRLQVGPSLAVISAGGSGFDVAEFPTHTASGSAKGEASFFVEWGIGVSSTARGGLGAPQPAGVMREVGLPPLHRSAFAAGGALVR